MQPNLAKGSLGMMIEASVISGRTKGEGWSAGDENYSSRPKRRMFGPDVTKYGVCHRLQIKGCNNRVAAMSSWIDQVCIGFCTIYKLWKQFHENEYLRVCEGRKVTDGG